MSSVKSRTRSDYGYFLTYRTRWSDNDIYNHLNNVVYNILIDSVVNSYLITHCGMMPTTSPSIGLMVSSSCTFVSSCAFPAVLELGLRVNKMGTSSVTYEVGIFEEGIEGVKAVGGFTHVFCDSVHRRPMKLLRAYREGLEKLLVRAGEEEKEEEEEEETVRYRSAKL